MNKPDGITQDAWDAAEQALSSPVWFDGDESPLHEAIARAIQSAVEAERDECAKIAFFTDVPSSTAMKIAEAIRSRKGA